MERRKVLLLGNGINRIDNDYSWENLMHDLLKFAGLGAAISIKEKPFPLLYEEIFMRWLPQEQARRKAEAEEQALNGKGPKPSSTDSEEYRLKSEIGELIRNIRSNSLHYKALQIDVDEIMTTNYDYNLQSVSPGGYSIKNRIKPVKGSKYSIMRRYKAGKKVLWHIHGEINAAGTILLGYEQYAGYLQHIRNYMIEGYEYKDDVRENGKTVSKEVFIAPLMARLRSKEVTVHSWVDHFFLNDIYILGLNMDFVEIHLWWLIDFRARLRYDPRYNINNRITFLYPGHETSWIKPRIDMLCACGVACIALPVEQNNWKGMYSMALDYIGKRPLSTDAPANH